MSPKNKGKFGKAKPAVEQEDEFVSGVTKLGRALKPYSVQFGIAAGLVILVVIGMSTYQWWQERKAAQATALYMEALSTADRPVEPPAEDSANAEDGADPKTEGELVGEAAAGPVPFKSEAERAQAVLAVLDRMQGDYGSTELVQASRLLRAKTLLQLDRPDDALAIYQSYRQSYRGGAETAVLRFAAQEGVGYAYEAKAAKTDDPAARQAALEQALEAFRQIQPAEQGPNKEYALYHEARILTALDRRDEAMTALKAAAALEDSALKNDIENRLALLQGAAAE